MRKGDTNVDCNKLLMVGIRARHCSLVEHTTMVDTSKTVANSAILKRMRHNGMVCRDTGRAVPSGEFKIFNSIAYGVLDSARTKFLRMDGWTHAYRLIKLPSLGALLDARSVRGRKTGTVFQFQSLQAY